jgi:hypothetical protein
VCDDTTTTLTGNPIQVVGPIRSVHKSTTFPTIESWHFTVVSSLGLAGKQPLQCQAKAPRDNAVPVFRVIHLISGEPLALVVFKTTSSPTPTLEHRRRDNY